MLYYKKHFNSSLITFLCFLTLLLIWEIIKSKKNLEKLLKLIHSI